MDRIENGGKDNTTFTKAMHILHSNSSYDYVNRIPCYVEYGIFIDNENQSHQVLGIGFNRMGSHYDYYALSVPYLVSHEFSHFNMSLINRIPPVLYSAGCF